MNNPREKEEQGASGSQSPPKETSVVVNALPNESSEIEDPAEGLLRDVGRRLSAGEDPWDIVKSLVTSPNLVRFEPSKVFVKLGSFDLPKDLSSVDGNTIYQPENEERIIMSNTPKTEEESTPPKGINSPNAEL